MTDKISHAWGVRMGIHPQYSIYPQVHSHIISSQGARIMLLLWLKIPTAGVRAKCMQCRSLSLPNHNNEELLQRINSDDTTRNVRFTHIYIYSHLPLTHVDTEFMAVPFYFLVTACDSSFAKKCTEDTAESYAQNARPCTG